jgi:uridine kinase
MFEPWVKAAIDRRLTYGRRVIVGIDGRAGSGKSTLATRLGEIYHCDVIRMDDFFLQPFQRTPERLAEPGGNVDRERFFHQVLTPLRVGQPFSYRPYDCHTEQFGDPVHLHPGPVSIVEGSYALHPLLADAYQLKVFLTLDPVQQIARLKARNLKLLNRFVTEWIPLEEKYFEYYHIPDSADLVLDTGDPGNTQKESQ